MAGQSGQADRRLNYLAALGERPWAHDFYQVMRRLEALYPQTPRFGEARRPSDEPVRLGQQAELSFAPATLSAMETTADGKPRVLVRFLGFWGPQGPLPLHLTEFARERLRNYDDPTLVRFADLFHHRLLLQFYRAWRQAQPTASRDRPESDRFRTYVGAMTGHGMPGWLRRDAVADDARRFHAGTLSRAARNPEGLADILTSYLRIPVEVFSFSPRWLALPQDQRTRLGATEASSQLGMGAVAGKAVFDVQHHFQLRMGPMTLAQYENLLPDGPWFVKLRDWVREYTGEEWRAHAATFLRPEEVPPARLGAGTRLGWTSWLGRSSATSPVPGVELELSAPVS